MKNKINALFVMMIIAAAIFYSCKKDRVPQDDYQNMDSFYSDNQEEEQELQVDSGSGGNCFVMAIKGTRICITRDMLKDIGGNDIPSYPFQLKVIELYTIKDMILRKQPSVAGTTVLNTTAEIKVRPFKDGNEAFLKSGRAYLMETASFTSTDSSMISYYGFDQNGTGNWTTLISDFIPGFLDTMSSVTATPAYYILTPATTGYVSAAKAYQPPVQSTPISFSVTGTNTQNIQIFLSFNNVKSVIKVENLTSIPVPIGETVTLVAFAKKQTNDFVLHKETFTVTAGQTITLNMQVISESSLLTSLESL